MTDRSLEPRGTGRSQELNPDPPFNQPLTYWDTRSAEDTVSTVTFSLYNRHLISCIKLTRYLHYLPSIWPTCRYYWRVSCHAMSCHVSYSNYGILYPVVTQSDSTVSCRRYIYHTNYEPCLRLEGRWFSNPKNTKFWEMTCFTTITQSHTVQLPLSTLQKEPEST